jgi:hypothetical protein
MSASIDVGVSADDIRRIGLAVEVIQLLEEHRHQPGTEIIAVLDLALSICKLHQEYVRDR